MNRTSDLTRRLWAALLALCLTLSLALPVFADDTSTNPPVTTEHKHCLCGKTHTDVGDHTSESQIEFATKLWYDKDNMITSY